MGRRLTDGAANHEATRASSTATEAVAIAVTFLNVASLGDSRHYGFQSACDV